MNGYVFGFLLFRSGEFQFWSASTYGLCPLMVNAVSDGDHTGANFFLSTALAIRPCNP